jgi:hypothetical protein
MCFDHQRNADHDMLDELPKSHTWKTKTTGCVHKLQKLNVQLAPTDADTCKRTPGSHA